LFQAFILAKKTSVYKFSLVAINNPQSIKSATGIRIIKRSLGYVSIQRCITAQYQPYFYYNLAYILDRTPKRRP